ncbi:MAG: plastocyanin/azurin family copper-binding protein [Actinomycetota bacterium]|nr:plastocyanin/azurin family copper-binding protein [Actinomycetota bacterium]
MIRRFFILAVAATALMVFPAPSLGDTFRVRATGSAPGEYRWDPDFRHITKGDRVVWRNPTDTSHTITAYSNNWSKNTTIAAGERTAKRFRRRGSYLYRCTRPGHSTLAGDNCSGMCGEIHVVR